MKCLCWLKAIVMNNHILLYKTHHRYYLVFRLKYITVDKTPEKSHGLRGIPIFEQDVKTNVADVEFAMARLFDEKTPKLTRPTPTRFRSSPRKHLLKMEENLIRSADTPPIRRSPRKLSNYFLTNGDGFQDHQKLDQATNSSLNG